MTRAGSTSALLALAAGAWVVTVERMEGMVGNPTRSGVILARREVRNSRISLLASTTAE